MTLFLIIIAILLGAVALVCLAVTADRSARATAWRQIAAERRSRAGISNEFTQRNTTFMTWNLLHLAQMLTAAGGFPAHGNQRSEWDAGARFDYPNPEYRT